MREFTFFFKDTSTFIQGVIVHGPYVTFTTSWPTNYVNFYLLHDTGVLKFLNVALKVLYKHEAQHDQACSQLHTWSWSNPFSWVFGLGPHMHFQCLQGGKQINVTQAIFENLIERIRSFQNDVDYRTRHFDQLVHRFSGFAKEAQINFIDVEKFYLPQKELPDLLNAFQLYCAPKNIGVCYSNGTMGFWQKPSDNVPDKMIGFMDSNTMFLMGSTLVFAILLSVLIYKMQKRYTRESEYQRPTPAAS